MSDSETISPRLSRESGRNIFGTDAAGYDAARPGYPAALYETIAAYAGSPFRAIGEIGPGTGLATSAMLEFEPERYVAFEPDTALAAYLGGRFANVDVVNDDFCAAEVEGPFDLIGAASCFHWLDPEIAMAKARSLLHPGGTLAIWWNVYREAGVGDDFADAMVPLLAGIPLPPSEGKGRHYSFDRDLHEGHLAGAGFTRIEHHVFRRERTLTGEEMRSLYATFSLVRYLSEDRRKALLDAIGDLVETRFGGAAPNVLLSPLYLATAPAK